MRYQYMFILAIGVSTRYWREYEVLVWYECYQKQPADLSSYLSLPPSVRPKWRGGESQPITQHTAVPGPISCPDTDSPVCAAGQP